MRTNFKSLYDRLIPAKTIFEPVSDESNDKSDGDLAGELKSDKEDIDYDIMSNFLDYTGQLPSIFQDQINSFSDLDAYLFGKSYSKGNIPINYSTPSLLENQIKIENRNMKVTKDQLLSIADLLNKKGINVKITSLDRPGSTTKSGKKSWHASGQAMDIVPESGDFTQLLEALHSDQEVRQLMAQLGVGFLDETTEEMMKRTGATGKHIHIGPDKIAILQFNGI